MGVSVRARHLRAGIKSLDPFMATVAALSPSGTLYDYVRGSKCEHSNAHHLNNDFSSAKYAKLLYIISITTSLCF